MFGIGTQELLIVLVVALLLVGPKRLPEVAKMLGKGFSQIKGAADDLQSSIRLEMEAAQKQAMAEKYKDLLPPGAPLPGASEDLTAQPGTKSASAPSGEETGEKTGDGSKDE